MAQHRIGAIGATLITAATVLVGPAAHGTEPPEPERLIPVDGTAWTPAAGVPDGVPDGQQGLAFTVYNASTNPLVLAQRALFAALDLGPDSGSEYDAAIFTGLNGQPGSSLRGLSYAINNPAGIEPCWDIGYLDSRGNAQTLHVDPTTRGSDFVTQEPPDPASPGWTRYRFAIHLPTNTTLTGLTLGADVTSDPPEPARVAFDNIAVTTDTATNSWNNATLFGLPGGP